MVYATNVDGKPIFGPFAGGIHPHLNRVAGVNQLTDGTIFIKDIDGKLLSKIAPHLHNIITSAKELHIDYLQLNRKSPTLSGGENQRIALIKQLNSPLKGITYILDEPSAGLSYENIQYLLRT